MKKIIHKLRLKKYLVVFGVDKGFVQCIVTSPMRYNTENQIARLREEFLKKHTEYESAVIMSIRRLRRR